MGEGPPNWHGEGKVRVTSFPVLLWPFWRGSSKGSLEPGRKTGGGSEWLVCLSLAGNAKWLVRIGDQKKGPRGIGGHRQREAGV